MPEAWAGALVRRGVRFIQLSTDYVFSGDALRPYREEDATGPRSVYGTTKREGELRVLAADPSALVVRTSWVFGPGRNFVVAILDQAMQRRSGQQTGPIRVVDDQQGRPTAAADLAEALVALCRRGGDGSPAIRGRLHLANAGETTWFGFAQAILAQAGLGEIPVEPVATGAFETAAPRPAYSVLDTDRAEALGLSMRPWTDALAGYLAGPDRPTHLIPDRPGRASASAVGAEPGTAVPGRSPDPEPDQTGRRTGRVPDRMPDRNPDRKPDRKSDHEKVPN
jgi:dTDP-4-dehydrorhamnose reductase